MTFTNHQYDELETFIKCSCERFQDRGLTYETDDDMEAYANTLDAAGHYISVPHDPKLNHLSPGNSYWGKLLDSEGRTIAGHAQQLIVTHGIWHEIRSGRLYADRKPTVLVMRQGLHENLELSGIAGRVVFGGSAWIHPDWREADHSKSLYSCFMALSRAVSLRHWDADFYTALFKDTPRRRQLGFEGADFERAVALSHGPSPANNGQILPLILMWSTRDYILNRVSRANFLAQAAVDEGVLRYRIA